MNTQTKTRANTSTDLTPVAEPEVTGQATVAKAAKAVGGGLLGYVAQSSEKAEAKLQHRQRIRQHLAEVADMAKASGEEAATVTEKASEVAFELYEARVSGELSPAEVNDILGDIFGVKGTGKNVGRTMKPGEKGAGKTPAGMGTEIRNRVVRAFAAWDFVNNGPSPSTKYFDDFEPDEVSPLIERLSASSADNGLTVWTFYRDISEMKREKNDPVPFHLNPERIAGFASKIGENVQASAKAIQTTPELLPAYAGLLQTLMVINELIEA